MTTSSDNPEPLSGDLANLVERLLKIGRECAAHMNEPFLSEDHARLLYDEKGLPR
jgi:antitoxin VapB